MVNGDDVTASRGALADAALCDARKLVPVRSSLHAVLELVEHEEDDDVAADPTDKRWFYYRVRDGEVPQMTTSPQSTSPCIWEDLAPGTGPQSQVLTMPES